MVRNIGLATLIALLFGFNMALAEETPAPPDKSAIRTGDQWSYDITDEVTGDLKYTLTYTVMEISGSEINTRVTKRGDERAGMAIFDTKWNLKDDGAFRKKPHDGTGFELPLQIGKEWKFSSNAQLLKTGEGTKSSGKSKVVAQEKITTQAGNYDTFKIVTEIRESQSSDPSKISTTTMETWYAPDVNRWVKRTYLAKFAGRIRSNYTMELIDYSRRPE